MMSAAGKQPSRKAAFVDEVYRPNNEMHYKINAAESAEELKTLYDAWAGDFDSWHDRVNGANIPAVELVKFLVHHVPPPLATRRLLDVGAGTGTQAVYLQEYLQNDAPEMTALEPSRQMLEMAKSKGRYTAFIQEALPSAKLHDLAGRFGIVMCCASLLPTHMQGEMPFREMLRAAEGGAYLVFNIRRAIIDRDLGGFHTALQKLTKEGVWEKVAEEERPYQPDEGVTAYYYCFRKCGREAGATKNL